MNPEDLKNQIEDLKSKFEEFKNLKDKEKKEEEEKLEKLKELFEKHAHSGYDSTIKLKYGFEIGQQEISYFGNSAILQLTSPNFPTIDHFYIASGKDRGLPSGSAQSSLNTVLELQNQTTDSFFFGTGHVYTNSPFSVTLAGNTLTDTTFNWTVNALAGMYINIYNSVGTLIETQVIASNTASVITITGTWLATTTGGIYLVFTPCYNGSASNPWRRLYTGEGTGEGIRFGYGVTAGGQNGLLYMDATGDLFWRDKTGTATKIFRSASTPLSGTKVYYVSDTSGGLVTRKLTFTNGILTAET